MRINPTKYWFTYVQLLGDTLLLNGALALAFTLQFINVLKGHMSIVGPRPERPFFVWQSENEKSGYSDRLLMKESCI